MNQLQILLQYSTGPLQSNISFEKVQNMVKIFSYHPRIKHRFKLNKKLSFQCVSEATVRKFMKNLPSGKATVGAIPVNIPKIVKFASLISLTVLTKPLGIISSQIPYNYPI